MLRSTAGLAVASVTIPALAAPAAAADTVEVDLLAGQTTPVGTLTIDPDDGELLVTYDTSATDWHLVETHLAVGDTVGDLPTNRPGNPKIGHFPYTGQPDPAPADVAQYTVDVNGMSGDVSVAAHAVVADTTDLADGEESMYLSSSRPRGAAGGDEAPYTELYEIELDDATGEANLTFLAQLDAPFEQIDALAATPDGASLYVYDKDSGHLGRYDLASDALVDVGQVANDPGDVVLATFDPEGTLYVASQRTNSLYTVDVTTPSASLVGDTGINLGGADMAFDAAGTLYLFSNETNGLYTVDLADGAATFVCDSPPNLTGIAFREGGLTDVVGSVSGFPGGMAGEFVVFDRDTCAVVDTYPMLVDGEPLIYESGDMTTGMLGDPREETAWGDGARFVERGNWATYVSYELDDDTSGADDDGKTGGKPKGKPGRGRSR